MSEKGFRNELTHVVRLKTLLEGDTVLPLRIEITPESLDLRRFRLTLSGVPSLTGIPPRTVDRFTLLVEVPSGYPQYDIPIIHFVDLIPFHPEDYQIAIVADSSLAKPDALEPHASWIGFFAWDDDHNPVKLPSENLFVVGKKEKVFTLLPTLQPVPKQPSERSDEDG